MSKIICDVCGTSYPETATQCPICGCVSPGSKTVSGDTDSAAQRPVGTYTYVKGGRFSKANVRKRNQQNQSPASERKNVHDSDAAAKKTEKGLVIAVIVLLLAVIAVVVYIALRIFGPALPQKNPDNASTTAGSQIDNTTNSDIVDTTVECTDILILSEAPVVLAKQGDTYLLSVMILPEDTTDKTVTFTSDDETIATVEQGSGSLSTSAKITAIAPGQTTITITCGSVTKTCVVECTFEPDEPVIEDPVYPTEDFKLNREDFTMSMKGETHLLYRGEIPVDVIEWKSDNEDVATIVDGVVTAVGGGTTKVYATYADITLECIVRCNIATGTTGGNTGTTQQHPEPYRLSQQEASLRVGESFDLYLIDGNGKVIDVQWVSSDTSCTVNGNTITRVSADTYTEISTVYQNQTFICKLYTR